jgi:hypothetical protein
MRRWLPLIILAAAQFVIVLDSSVMNVSISQIVADLDTTVTGVQAGFTTRIAENPALSEPVRAEITAATEQGIEIVTPDQAHAAAISAGRLRRCPA